MNLKEFNKLIEEKINTVHTHNVKIYNNTLDCGFEEKFIVSAFIYDHDTKEMIGKDSFICYFLEGEVLIYKNIQKLFSGSFRGRICDFEFNPNQLKLDDEE